MNPVELNELEGQRPLVTVIYLQPPVEAEHGPNRNICTFFYIRISHFLLGDPVCVIDVFICMRDVFFLSSFSSSHFSQLTISSRLPATDHLRLWWVMIITEKQAASPAFAYR